MGVTLIADGATASPVDAAGEAEHETSMTPTHVLRVLLLALGCIIYPTIMTAAPGITYPAQSGPGGGRHLVFLTGDEEYRS